MNYKLKNKVVYLVLFVLGFSIPKISALLVIIYGLIKLLRNLKTIVSNFALELLLLFLFLNSYYITGIYYGFYSIDNLMFFPLFSLTAYIIGATIDLKKYQISWLFLSLLIGIMTYTSFSVYQTYFTGSFEVALVERRVTDMWSGVSKNSPVFGAYVLMCLALFPVLLLKTVSKFEKSIILALLSLSIVIILLFQSRAPFLSAFIIFCFVAIYTIKIHKQQIINFKLLVLLVIAGSIFYSLNNDNKITQAYSDRLEKQGTDSARYELWTRGLKGLYENPLGGKEINLTVDSYRSEYVHNMWLDINNEAGILPLYFLLMFIFKHKKYFNVFKEKGNLKTKIYFLGFFFALLLPTFFEPMLNASFIFMALVSFTLALLKNYYMNSQERKKCYI